MYKTREDVEAMIDLIELIKISLVSFGFWIIDSLSIPSPGVVCHDTRFLKDTTEST